MQVKGIPAAPVSDSIGDEWLRHQVTSVLPAGVVASALAASDMPTRRVELTAEQQIGYAVQGLKRIGIAGARRHDAQAHAVNIKFGDIADRKYGGTMPASAPEMAEWKAQDRALWGNSRREQRAYDVAYRVTGVLGRRQAATLAEVA